MSRSIRAGAVVVPLMLAFAGCASAPDSASAKRANANPTPSWNKYYVAGSRIPRTLDAQGQPQSGMHVITITDEELQNSAGMLLGEKLSGGNRR